MTKDAQKLEIAVAALREIRTLTAVCDHDRGGPAAKALREIAALSPQVNGPSSSGEVTVEVTRSIRLKPLPPFTEPEDPA